MGKIKSFCFEILGGTVSALSLLIVSHRRALVTALVGEGEGSSPALERQLSSWRLLRVPLAPGGITSWQLDTTGFPGLRIQLSEGGITADPLTTGGGKLFLYRPRS